MNSFDSRRWQKIFFSALWAVLCLIPGLSRAASLPESYATVESEHFVIHFPEHLEKFARYALLRAEKSHVRLSPYFDWTPASKTQLVVSDDGDFANGSAITVPYNKIELFAYTPDVDEELGDYDDWIEVLVMHEYTHILQIDMTYGLHNAVNAVLGKTLAMNSTLPRWLKEGLAVTVESRFGSAGRLNSARYADMINAFARGRFLKLSDLGSTPLKWPGGSAWYLFGGFFVDYIAQRFGYRTWIKYSHEYARETIPFAYNRIAGRVWKSDFPTLYDDWRYDRIGKALAVSVATKAYGSVNTVRRLIDDAYRNRRLTRKDRKTLSFVRDNGEERKTIATLDPESKTVADLFACAGNCKHRWDAKGETLFYIDTGLARRYEIFNDLYLYRDGSKKRLTRGLRIRDFALAEKEQALYLVVDNVPDQTLMRLKIDDLSLESIHELPFLDNIGDISYHDGKIYGSYFSHADRRRDIVSFDVKSKTLSYLTQDKAVDLAVRIVDRDLCFVSDRRGVFDLYVIRDFLDNPQQARRITNLDTGIYDPVVESDKVYFTYYTDRGMSVGETVLDQNHRFSQENWRQESINAQIDMDESEFRRQNYRAYRWLFPKTWLPVYEYVGIYKAGIAFDARDPVGHFGYTFRTAFEFKREAFETALSMTYTGLPVDLSLSLSYFRSQGTFYDNKKAKSYDAATFASTFALSDAFLLGFSNFGYSLAYAVTHLSPREKIRPSALPDAAPPSLPRFGFNNSLYLGARWARIRNREGEVLASSGASASVSAKIDAPFLASRYTRANLSAAVQAYIPLPLRMNIAIRSGFGISMAKRKKERGRFSVSGDGAFTVDGLLSNITGQAILRGYGSNIYTGSRLFYTNAEFRFPILGGQWGYHTFPVVGGPVLGAVFSDFAYADDRNFDFRYAKVNIGAEIRARLAVFGQTWLFLRLGYAYGFSPGGGNALYVTTSQLF